ncbi:uncharacterized protein LOC132255855 [Phlebotomus argentipes]|uniref:uncharacterized protein LOC132255855 n=1 Tax=Phlebotomus argentipes TaxID=94469 RepID=UPI00289323D0|nr:uncharacterized protein LOC132255855 [Phlebotomus argentipes]
MSSVAMVFALLALHAHFLGCDNVCWNVNTEHLVTFYPSRHCQRSNKSILMLENFQTVEQCANLARESKALAFNYAPTHRGTINKFINVNKTTKPFEDSKYPSGKDIIEQSEEYFNCQILQCPELKNLSTMINDTRFEYYSLYVNPPLPLNATCMPGLGMFVYYDKPENFTRAFNICRELKGKLADVLSEQRTNLLSKWIKSKFNTTHRDMAFVDLKELENNGTVSKHKYYTSDGFPIDCFPYRAWSPGFPRTECNLTGESGECTSSRHNTQLHSEEQISTAGVACRSSLSSRRLWPKRPARAAAHASPRMGNNFRRKRDSQARRNLRQTREKPGKFAHNSPFGNLQLTL